MTADGSQGYRRARLWLEATLRKTPLPIDDPTLAVSGDMLADSLDYQRTAVRTALDPATLRPRILLADAVGLGKTLEIGMILAELVRRGRGERILIVTPRHVLEQMQHELWTRFALPFVRLDSLGIQRVRRQLPATRNPFGVYKRAIISIDTLKSDRYLNHLRKHRWDAVVIDESHNITNSATQNNRLANVLAPSTDALILASATPHNGRKESFAELIRLLEPSAVSPTGDVGTDDIAKLVVRRHRHSPEVASIVGGQWAERREPRNVLVRASPAEDEIACEIAEQWLYRPDGSTGTSAAGLFAWTLAKAFLSSPAALAETARNRLKNHHGTGQETASLTRLAELCETAAKDTTGKYGGLVRECARIGIGPTSTQRVVVFAERLATLHWLRERLMADLKMSAHQVQVMHGGLSDVEQQEIVDSFKQEGSPIRVLVTGDVASEGVNLHLQCHELIHFDIPWSLIRIEQRNGRIDRYGQRHAPQITTLLLQPSDERFSGDLKVLASLMTKEHEAHTALGDSASLMGKYDVAAEEAAILKVLQHRACLDDVVAAPADVAAGDDFEALWARLAQAGATPASQPAGSTTTPASSTSGLYADPAGFLKEAVAEIYVQPAQQPSAVGGGIGWVEHEHLVEFVPPPDLRARLSVLPQSYLGQREVTRRLKLATSKPAAQSILADALKDPTSSSWPEAHFLGPLHPVLDWASDRALGRLGRGEIFAIRGDTGELNVLLMGTLTNRAGQTVSQAWMQVEFPDPGSPGFAILHHHDSAAAMLAAVGVTSSMSNPGKVADVESLSAFVPVAVDKAEAALAQTMNAAAMTARALVEAWSTRAREWTHQADALAQRGDLTSRRLGVQDEERLAHTRLPSRSSVRPLLMVLPAGHPVDHGTHGGM